ncbi:ATP-binding cassette domain-containing protein [Streptomyces sp. RY43-2]|uniref:ATP-binding cassette domain-containing protein n=2 Tax=Streptomyces macrolidinus TaxID=2952607 RepID=A0ABT0Z7Q8_9ACTN|nr:ATP-binding cassette domain-containing protein [Streptomyces macrolidinus]MCN9239799.1 ATP-binding cassette domain-containing protein [Streptomyces macrolidinus]
MDLPRTAAGAAVHAVDFGVKGPRGWAFRNVSFTAEPGSLIAVEGPSGAGRTCLLLALTGRMKPSEGHAEVDGIRLPRHLPAVRRISALAHVPGVTDLDPALTVGEHLRERALLASRFGDSLRALLRPRARRAAEARARIDSALAAAGLDPETLPKGPRTAVRDLERLEALRLSVALALIGRPRLLAVDDTDLKLSAAERADAWGLLRSLAEAGTTVLAVCGEAPEGAVVVTTTPRAGTAGSTEGRRVDAVREEPAEDGAGTGPDKATQDNGRTHNGRTDNGGTPAKDIATDEGPDDDKETAYAHAEAGRA